MSTVETVDDQSIEMKKAAEEARQPICAYCKHPLNMIQQAQSTIIRWTWMDDEYRKDDSGGDADPATHECDKCPDGCQSSDWEFVDENLVSY